MLDFQFRLLFFDDKRLVNEIKAEDRKVLSSIGAQLRTRARNSMRPARRLRKNEITPQIAEEQLGLPPGTDISAMKGRLAFKLPYKSSDPGQPPRTRKGKQLKRLLFFAWDPIARTVVVGPKRFGTGSAKTLEEGGTSTITIIKRDRKISKSTPAQRAGLEKARANGRLKTRKRPSRVTKTKKTIRIKPRPYLAPPFQKILPQIPQKFRGVIR